MGFEEPFLSLWNQPDIFHLPDEQPKTCLYAQKFSEWTEELCAKTTRNPDIVSVNQAKLLLLDKYFDWRTVVPKAHRARISTSGHACIFQVFTKAYESLKAIELTLTPPMLFVPPQPLPPPPPPPPPQIAGIFLGELDQP